MLISTGSHPPLPPSPHDPIIMTRLFYVIFTSLSRYRCQTIVLSVVNPVLLYVLSLIGGCWWKVGRCMCVCVCRGVHSCRGHEKLNILSHCGEGLIYQ